MQVQTIGLSSLNNTKLSQQNNLNQYNNLKSINDTVSFNGEKISEQDKCRQLLAKSGMNPYPRMLVEKELNSFKTELKKSEVLKDLLNIGNDKGTKLKATDMINYFTVLSGAPKNSQHAVIDLLKVEKEELASLTSSELDNAIFLPLENNENIMQTIGKIYSKYEKLPQTKRMHIISSTFEILNSAAEQGKDFCPLAKKIANKCASMPDDIGVYAILADSIPYCDNKKFEKLISKLDEKSCALLYPLADSCKISQRVIDAFLK